MTRYITFGDSHPLAGHQVCVIGETITQLLAAAIFNFGHGIDTLRSEPLNAPVACTIVASNFAEVI